MKHIVDPPYARHHRSQLHPFANRDAHAEEGRRTFLRGEGISEILTECRSRIRLFRHGFPCSGRPVPAPVSLETQRIYEAGAMETHVSSFSSDIPARLCARRGPPLVRKARSVRQFGANQPLEDRDGPCISDPGTKSGQWAAPHRVG